MVKRAFGTFSKLVVIGLYLVFAPALLAQNVVLEWNEAVLDSLSSEATPPLLVARNLTILHLGMDQALLNESSSEAAAIGAGYTSAIALMPSHRGDFEKLREKQWLALSNKTRKTSAFLRGQQAAQKILIQRADDGCAMQVSYVPRTEPGQWRRTPPFLRPPEAVQWAEKVEPFVIHAVSEFRPNGPPPLTSSEYAAAYNEVKSIGGKTSLVRTPEETLIAKFWSDFSYTETPPGHWNSIARILAEQKKLSLQETASLFATLNTAMVDAGIVCWNTKYHYNFWRPVTAIRRASEDGNAATEPDPDWMPLLNTPAHPDYPSGHSVFSGAAVAVLTAFNQGDQILFTVKSDAMPKVTRPFSSLKACAAECARSRVLCGIHFSFSCEAGLKIGEKVGAEVVRKLGNR